MRVVAVFGGGGAKSLAHAGAWKALLEAGLRPCHIIGTSMGAVISAALAAGSSYERLVEIALSLERKDFAALDAWSLAKGVFAGSVLRPGPLKRTIARLVPATRFADLQIPLTVTTTDLDSGELVLFGALGQDAPLIDAARLIVVRAVAEREATFDVGAGQRFFDAGYRETKRALG